MALLGLGRSLVGPALNQDGPLCVSAVHLDALARRHGEPRRVQLPAQLLTEQIQHGPFSVALLTRAAWRQLIASLTGSSLDNQAGRSKATIRGSGGAIRLLVVISEPFIDYLAVRAGVPSHHPGALQLAADLG
jgi:hypothetical protein